MKILIAVFLTVMLFLPDCTTLTSKLSLLLPLSAYQDPTASYSESHSANEWGQESTNIVTHSDELGLKFFGIQSSTDDRQYHKVKNYNSSDAVDFKRLGHTKPAPPKKDESGTKLISPPYFGAPNGLPYYPTYGMPNNPWYGPPNGMPGNPWHGAPNGMPYNPPYPAPNNSPYGIPNNPSYGGSNNVPIGTPYNPSYGGPNTLPNGMPINQSHETA